MFLDQKRPNAFREKIVSSTTAAGEVSKMRAAMAARINRSHTVIGYAIHLAHDQTRLIGIEVWETQADYYSDKDASEPGANLFCWAHTGGLNPTPIADTSKGVIIIDTFPVWRPLLWPVSKFNIRNGRAFNAEPGCISTTVLTAVKAGRIATYARWETEADFAAAFSKQTSRHVESADGINAAAASMTFGMIRPDYHTYELVDYKEVQK